MTVLQLNSIKTWIPNTWDELNRKQLLQIAALTMETLPEYDFKIKALLILTGWKLQPVDYTKKRFGVYVICQKQKFRLLPWQVAAICRKLDFLLSETETKNGKVIRINSKLTCNLLPYINPGIWYQRLRPLYGPSDRLYNLTFGEYLTADNFFRRYVATSDHQFLDKLIATLYRPQDGCYDPDDVTYRGDRRQPFNEFTVEKRCKRVQKLTPETKTAIVLWFNGCLAHIATMFPNVFSGKGSGKDKFGSLTLVDHLTNGDVTKSEAVRKQYLWDVLVHLENAITAHKDMTEKLKKK